eukprot:366183-Chlamydomonas_euryale.AAC.4
MHMHAAAPLDGLLHLAVIAWAHSLPPVSPSAYETAPPFEIYNARPARRVNARNTPSSGVAPATTQAPCRRTLPHRSDFQSDWKDRAPPEPRFSLPPLAWILPSPYHRLRRAGRSQGALASTSISVVLTTGGCDDPHRAPPSCRRNSTLVRVPTAWRSRGRPGRGRPQRRLERIGA